jgi:hypothetical protein
MPFLLDGIVVIDESAEHRSTKDKSTLSSKGATLPKAAVVRRN